LGEFSELPLEGAFERFGGNRVVCNGVVKGIILTILLLKDGTLKSYKLNTIIEKDEHGYYAFCPELEGCCSQGRTIDEVMKNIREAMGLYLETLTLKERNSLIHRELITSSIEVCVA